ncbi:unnamed protein product [Brassicogethes aeneus]|uniref:Pseudouridine synthase II N-terminal domain-containing protein n=1 Tax=Brassicogethes aeneus TaxID=1431903 RepID=A0A9P0FJV9_BRAAE|nr:unnamed protein product [Brassicogethes aeneus]
MLVKEAPVIWNLLKGIVCVYKPAEITCENLRKALLAKICADLNNMECRSISERVVIEGNPLEKLTVNVVPNLADHPAVVGPRYLPDELPASWSNYLGWNTCGILLFGLREGTRTAKYLRENRPMRAYKLKGTLGKATDNGLASGKVVEKSTWKHVTKSHMEKLLSSIQSSHQKQMFQLCGVDLQSQTAYDLAVQGPIRPANSKVPLLYGIKCIEFTPPNFVIEVHCINENESYLTTFIHEIGTKLHSTAHCTALQCVRHSCFTLEDALLKKHFTLQNVLTNMEKCSIKLEENKDLLYQKSASLTSINTE